MGHQFKDLGSCGGAAATATPGAFSSGTKFAAQGNYSGAVDGVQQMDLRKGNAAGAGPKSAAKSSGFNQGDQFAAQRGGAKPGSHKDLRGGNTPVGSGYKQGPVVVATVK